MLNRLAPVDYIANSWACERSLDGIRNSLDFLLTDFQFQFVKPGTFLGSNINQKPLMNARNETLGIRTSPETY
jgi:hypothetical protein